MLRIRAFQIGERIKHQWTSIPSSASLLPRLRTMSTLPTLHTFVVYAPDKTDEGTFQRRLSVRESHLANAKVLKDSGKLHTGGAMLTPESIISPTAEKKMVGSMMLFKAETIEEVKKIIESDIYYTSGVWDPERVVILPFAGATL